ncbi:ATP-dependent RNA helicase [Perkinsela sp. CCAP 1560/4]|nr:ATP-dependent RNA helicase [Perkinsela sp. CCAP 1560/4]|eukprot:KNH08012.1 ATP-dependent RNA helicase [Perkinsela sp. CCAP 1560/4]
MSVGSLLLFELLKNCHFELRDCIKENQRSGRDATPLYYSMSEGEQMNVLVSQLSRRFHLFNQALTPCEWLGVFQEGGSITGITWNSNKEDPNGIDLGTGFLDTQWLPSRLQVFQMRNNEVKGIFCAASLPRSLLDFNIAHCLFMGTVEWKKLPDCMISLNVDSNYLEGSVDFAQVPPGLQYLVISANWFTEAVFLPPTTLEVLGLADIISLSDYQILYQAIGKVENNSILVRAKLGSMKKLEDISFHEEGQALSLNWANRGLIGSIDLCIVPNSVRFMYLENNLLIGVIDFDQLPRALEIMNLRRNKFSQCITLSPRTPNGLRFVDLRENQVTDVIHLDSGEHKPFVLWDGPSSTQKKESRGELCRFSALYAVFVCFSVLLTLFIFL